MYFIENISMDWNPIQFLWIKEDINDFFIRFETGSSPIPSLPFSASQDCQVYHRVRAGWEYQARVSHESKSDSVAAEAEVKRGVVVGSIQEFVKAKKDAAAPYNVGAHINSAGSVTDEQ